jgi:uncharacterized protein CbrC (UPF0167 family)
MSDKRINGECSECESSYSVEYTAEMVSEEHPEFCPFCSAPIEDLSEEYIEDDNSEDEEEWT